VECPNVHDDGGENRQAQRNEPTDQQKQASDYLEASDDVNVAAGKKGVQIFTSDTLRERRHRKEMQECIGTKDNEDQSEKNPGDNSENFHSSTITSWTANSNTEMVNAGSGRDQLRFFPKQFV
jgi:hypothetical protein